MKINYKEYAENEDFMEMLNYLRENCLLDVDQMIDELDDIDPEFIREHFDLIQDIIAEEISEGEVNDAYGADIAEGYINTLLK